MNMSNIMGLTTLLLVASSIGCSAPTPVAQRRVLSPPDCLNKFSERPQTGNHREISQDATLLSQDQARAQVKTMLVQEVCRGWSCNELEALIQIQSNVGGNVSCARASLAQSARQKWLAPAQTQLKQRTQNAAQLIIKHIPANSNNLIISPIEDLGFNGGERASLVWETLAQALKDQDLEVLPWPSNWNGIATPPQDLTLVHGQLRRSQDDPREIEVLWTVHPSTASSIERIPAYTFAEVLSAPIEPAQTRPPYREHRERLGIRLHQHYPQGGGLCVGQRATLAIEVKEPLYLRVFMLEGDTRALQIFPERADDSALVQPGAALVLDEIIGTNTPKRFVAFGTPTHEGLGVFKTNQGTCQVPYETALALHDGRGLPIAASSYAVAVESYRPLPPTLCKGYVSEVAMAPPKQEDIPLCW